MAEEKSETDLLGEAKRALLEQIPSAARNTTTGSKALKLAMAYTVLDRGKLPGSDVDSK